MGIDKATSELTELRDLVESGQWVPTGPERTCAAVILNARPGTDAADALVQGLHVAGPDAARPGADRLARVVVQCAAVLRQSPPSDASLSLVQDVRALLNLVVAAPLKRQQVGTEGELPAMPRAASRGA